MAMELRKLPGKTWRFEPRWADSTECLLAANLLAIANFSTVSAALGSVDSPAEKIRNARNFYAHRKTGTAGQAVTTNLFVDKDKLEVFDLAAYTTGNVRVIESWVLELNLVAVAATK